MAQLISGLGGRCLDIQGGQSYNGCPIILYSKHGGSNQQWTLTPEGFIVSSLDPAKCLDASGGVANNGTRIIIQDKHGGINQKWIYQQGFILSQMDMNKCIDVEGGIGQDGTPIILWDKHGGANQLWSFVDFQTPQNNATPITAQERTKVSTGRHLDSKATLYKNGYLQIETESKTEMFFYGLRGKVMVVCIDANGNAIYFSEIFNCTTRCSTSDPTCASQGVDTFVQKLPDAVGQYTMSIDITHGENSFHDFRRTLRNTMQLLVDSKKIIEPVAKEIALLFA